MVYIYNKIWMYYPNNQRWTMKKFNRIIALCLIAVVSMTMLTACGGNKKKFVGTWEELDADGEVSYYGTTLVLANDGTGSAQQDGMTASVTWSVEKDKVFITLSMCGVTETEEYTYKFSGDTLIMTDHDGEETVYRKK